MNTNLRAARVCLFVWIAVLLYPARLSSQDIPFRVSVFGGFSFLDSERAFIVDDDFFQSDFKNGGTFGFRANADITNVLGLEAAYGLSKTELRIIERQPLRERTYDLNVHRLDWNLNYNFRQVDEPLRPFATAGIGLARFSPSSDAKDLAGVRFIDEPTRISSSNKFSFNFGAGIEQQVSDLLGWRADLRDHITSMPRLGLPETPLSPGGVSFPVSGLVHNVALTFGLFFRLN